MTFNSIRQLISFTLDSFEFTGDEKTIRTNKILAGVLLYKTIMSLIQFNADYQSNLRETAKQYCETYKNEAESAENTYAIYKVIARYIVEHSIYNFGMIKVSQISDIQALYNNKRQIDPFDIKTFTPYMYRIQSIDSTHSLCLAASHKKVVVPIVEYYMRLYDIKPSAVIVEVDDTGYIGKIINLSIAGIPNNQIFIDIYKNLALIQPYLVDVQIQNEFVKLFIK